MVWLFSLKRRDRGSSPALAWGVTLFFWQKDLCQKKECKMGLNLKPAAPLVQALPLHNFGVWSWKLVELVFILLIYGCQHAIGPVLWDEDRVGIYPFNLELKFVTGISPSYLIRI